MTTQGSFDYDDLEFDLQDRMRKALRVGGVSANDMAETLEIHRNTISNYLSGRTAPSVAVLRVWALRCGVPFSWLRDGELPKNGPDGDGTTSDLGGSPSGRKGNRTAAVHELRPAARVQRPAAA